MRKKSCIMLAFVLLVGEMQGKDGIEHFLDIGLFGSVTTTPTNMMVQFSGGVYFVKYNPRHRNPTPRGDPTNNGDYIGKNEVLNLTPDQEVILSEHHGQVLFTPVSFKDQLKGIRILSLFVWGGKESTNTAATTYIALGDTLVEKSEDDVEMILDGKRAGISWRSPDGMEWKTYEKTQPVPKDEGRATASLPSRAESVTTTQDETPITVAEDEQDEEKNKASNFWLYIVIVLCALSAVLYFLRRKKARNSA